MFNPAFFGLLLFFSLLARLKLPFGNFGIHYPLIFAVGLTAIALNFTSLRSWVKRHPKLSALLAIFYLWIWVSACLSEFPATAIRYTVKYSTYLITFLSFSVLTYVKRHTLKYDRWVWIFLIIIACGGIVESSFPHLWLLDLIRYPDYYPRISSIVQGPNQFGVLMAIAAIFSLILSYRRSISKVEACSLGPFIVLTCLSASRNGWLTFLIGLFLLLCYRIIKPKTFLIIITLWIVCLVSLPVSAKRLNISLLLLSRVNPPAQVEQTRPPLTLPNPAGETRESSDGVRIKLWQAAIRESIDRPITGIGVGVFAEHIASKLYGITGFHAHNIFLSVLVELGIPGLIIFLSSIACLIAIIKHKQSHAIIPLILLGCSQQLDFFINDYTFMVIGLYFLSRAINDESSGDRSPIA